MGDDPVPVSQGNTLVGAIGDVNRIGEGELVFVTAQEFSFCS